MDKPISPPIPSTGIYWVKWAERTYQYNRRAEIVDDSYWEIGEWQLVNVEEQNIEIFGSDEFIEWNGDWRCVAVLGPKVERPE